MNSGPVFVVACVWEKEKGTGVVVMEAPIDNYQGNRPLNLPENFLFDMGMNGSSEAIVFF